jgi:hypothetical protein
MPTPRRAGTNTWAESRQTASPVCWPIAAATRSGERPSGMSSDREVCRPSYGVAVTPARRISHQEWQASAHRAVRAGAAARARLRPGRMSLKASVMDMEWGG